MPEVFRSTGVDLGFIEEIDSWKLKSKYFPSKVGGLPSWLALNGLPSEKELQCLKCDKPMIFLCQVYAPIESKEDCFHRTLFIFICREASCNSENNARNIKVFRSQIPRQNKYYSTLPSREVKETCNQPCVQDFVKICRVCGSLGPKVCGHCKCASYCSKNHQALDWKAGHKDECKNKELVSPMSLSSKNLLFAEYEIDLEPEEVELREEKSEEEVMAEYEKMLRKGQLPNRESTLDGVDPDAIDLAVSKTDHQFARFRNRIGHFPEQVLRYEAGGKPLLVSSTDVPKGISPCQECGGERRFEFQVMPQLLVHLKVDSTGDSIDWGTLIVYTCPNSCSKEGRNYIEEVVCKQDYSAIRTRFTDDE